MQVTQVTIATGTKIQVGIVKLQRNQYETYERWLEAIAKSLMIYRGQILSVKTHENHR